MNSPTYEFGPFRLDPANRQLFRGPDPIPLTPKVLDVLRVLVERRGQLVLKDDLLAAVWPDAHVTEANLSQTVFVLRKALGDTASTPRYIATVAGSGYRFVAPVTVTSPSVAPDVNAAAMVPPAVRRRRRLARVRRSAAALSRSSCSSRRQARSCCAIGIGAKRPPPFRRERRCWPCCHLPTSRAIRRRTTSPMGSPRR